MQYILLFILTFIESVQHVQSIQCAMCDVVEENEAKKDAFPRALLTSESQVCSDRTTSDKISPYQVELAHSFRLSKDMLLSDRLAGLGAWPSRPFMAGILGEGNGV